MYTGGIDSSYGGLALTKYMMKLLQRRGYNLTTTSEREIVRNMKEKLCFVAPHKEWTIKDSSSDKSEKEYRLPDGNCVTIGDEQFRCPEAMFQPSLFEIDAPSIQDMANQTILKCDDSLEGSIRGEMYGNIVLEGGSTLFPGFQERIAKEIVDQVPSSAKVNVVAMENRRRLSWTGGSILASLSTFQDMWITRKEYNESGSSIIHQKCSD